MLASLLGFDVAILQTVSLRERLACRLAGWLFAAVSASMVVADAWFGHLFYAGWTVIFMSGFVLGYIHFAVFRLALLTLTTRPMKEKESVSAGRFLAWFRPDFSSLMRLVFVSLIALAVSFPGAAMLFHREAENIQAEQRQRLVSELEGMAGQALYNPDARFPFRVFSELWQKPGYRLCVFLWMSWIFSPLVLLAMVRHADGMEYIRRVAEAHRNITERHYFAAMLEAQQELDRRFPGAVNLRDAGIYADPPFNTVLRQGCNRRFGNRSEFHAWLKTL